MQIRSWKKATVRLYRADGVLVLEAVVVDVACVGAVAVVLEEVQQAQADAALQKKVQL